jgi:N-acyl-D-amino-acid deacylase
MAVMGFVNRDPDETEMEQLKQLLDRELRRGAKGMSLGLIYPPSAFSSQEELVELSKVIAKHGGLLAVHMRNEGAKVFEAVDEMIAIARLSGAHVHISHLKLMGKPQWGRSTELLQKIRDARSEGIHITCDQYPYNCSMTIYTPCMPPWYFTEGTEALVDKLHDPALRAKIKAEMNNPASDYENFYRNSGGWDGVTLCCCPKTPEAEGKSVAAYAAEMGKDPFEAYFDLVIANRGVGTAVYHSISDDDIFDIIRLPYVMVGSDGLVGSRDEKCHPRGWGTMARAICAMTKDNPILPLETLIHRNTGMAAARFGLKNKGLLLDGYDADLVLFDYEALRDNATYVNPNALAGGILRVFIGGETVYRDGALTGATPGKLL